MGSPGCGSAVAAGSGPVMFREKTGAGLCSRDELVAERASRGHWARGVSGNPAGRPRGSGNRAHVQLRAILLEDAERIVQRVSELALEGDMTAAKMILDRILPRRICVPIADFDLPAMKTADDVCNAIGAIASAALDGRISPPDAAALAQIVETFRRSIETLDHERRIAELEERRKTRNVPPARFPFTAP